MLRLSPLKFRLQRAFWLVLDIFGMADVIRARRARYILVCECGRAWAESGLGGPLYMEYGSNEGPITH